jgi:hypothetical protein
LLNRDSMSPSGAASPPWTWMWTCMRVVWVMGMGTKMRYGRAGAKQPLRRELEQHKSNPILGHGAVAAQSTQCAM